MKTWVCCGVGGVGKTTISTALALFYAKSGKRVALITIDPAKRLQDALGVALTHQPTEVIPNLYACMLDAQKCFDELVGDIHPKKQEMLNNRYYQFASTRMGGIQEFMSVVLISKILMKPYDVLIIDTPPSRNAISFLQAPSRMTGLLEDSVLRYFVQSNEKSGILSMQMGVSLLSKALQQFLGGKMISDMTDFFSLFQPIAKEMNRVAKIVDTHLLSDSQFLYITTPSRPPFELIDFYNKLQQSKYQISNIIINRFPKKAILLSDVEQDAIDSAETLQAIRKYSKTFDIKYQTGIHLKEIIANENLIDDRKVISIPFHRFVTKHERDKSDRDLDTNNTEPLLKEYHAFFGYFDDL